MQSIWWEIFDLLGTTAFALSGSLVAISRRMDMFGIFVLSAATAVGGGIIRDIFVGRIPPVALRSSLYFWIIILTMLAISAGIRYFNLHLRSEFMNYSVYFYIICDAIGLGSFTVTGTLLGCDLYPDMMFLDITLGVVTAVGGGVIRDILAG
ncbi:MAG: TRIC cation channel family protein, partial [Megasphaera sp.]|nr:TRIC cation channel family protein [Megasphaera sp.]